jgi:hypothetical protein
MEETAVLSDADNRGSMLDATMCLATSTTPRMFVEKSAFNVATFVRTCAMSVLAGYCEKSRVSAAVFGSLAGIEATR